MQAGAERGAAASATQAAAARGAAVTQESLIRSTAQAAVVAAQVETDAATRTAAARMAATEAALAVQEAAYKTAMAVATGASEAEIAAARSVVAAQATASAEAAAAVTQAAAEETAAAEAAAAAQIAAARAVAEAQAIAATAGTASARAAAAESRAISQATVAANRAATAAAAQDAAAAAAATRAAAAETNAAVSGVEGAATRAAGAGSMMGLGIAAGVFMIGKSIVSQTRDYELAMNTLQGVTSAGAATMAHAGEVAKQLGADITIPGASAADAAHAMLELVKAGFSVSQAEEAAKASLQLAATAQIEAGKAAEFMGQSLNMFGLGADQASHAADVLANTANAASGNITDFMYAMNAAGPASHALGISLDDTATFMGMLAKAGILGSNAGTEYARMLQSMEKPSKKAQQALDDLGVSAWTADGQFRGLPVVIDQLSKAHATMTPQAYASAAAIAFGAHAVKAAVTVGAEGLPVWTDMASKIGVVGGNAEMATAMMQGLPGAMENIKNNASNLALTIGGALSPALTGILNGIAGMIGGFVAMPGPIQTAVLTLGAVTLLRGPLIAMWASIGTAVTGFTTRMAADLAFAGVEMSAFRYATMMAGSVIGGVFTSLKAAIMSNPIGLAIVGITTAISLFSGGADEAQTAVTDLSDAIDMNTGKWNDNAAATVSARLAQGGLLQQLTAAGVAQGMATDAILRGGDAVDSITKKLQDQVTAAQAAYDALTTYDTEGNAFSTGSTDQIDAAKKALADWTSVSGSASAAQHRGAAAAAEYAAATQGQADAANGAAGATDAAAAAADAATAAATGASYSAIALGGAFKDGSVSASELKTQVHDVMMQLDLLAGRNGDAEAAQRAFNQSIRDYSNATIDAAAAPRALTEAQIRLDDAKKKYNDTSDKTLSKTFTQADKDRELKQLTLDRAAAEDGLQKVLVDQTKAADNAAQKTADLVDQYRTAGQTAYNTAMLQGRQSTATNEAAAAMQGAKDSFIAAQVSAGMAADAAQALGDKLFGLPKDTALVIQAQTGQAVTSIQMLNDMKVADKNFKITATAVATGPLAGGIHISSPGGGAGTITFADGGVYEAGTTHAANGLLRQPMIVTGGKGITWAEPETGWEAYISGKPGQEAANRKILGVAAGRLGMSAVMGSDGAAAPVIGANTYSTSTHNVYHGGMGTGNLEAKLDQLITATRAGGGHTTKLADSLNITNTTSDGTAGLNRVLALMPRR